MEAVIGRSWSIFGRVVLALAPAFGAEAQTVIGVPLHYPTIQLAIDAAAHGDTVLVAPGTYVENINFSGKAITVTSEAGPEVTFIDGSGVDSVVKFISGEGRSSVLSGFTVLNGRGGIEIGLSSPTITGNIIANNRGCEGSGIAAGASPLIYRNTIINNRQSTCIGGVGGGGILLGGSASYPSSAEVIENIIAGNIVTSASGGGMSASSFGTPIIRGNIINGNIAAGANGCGGGISMQWGSDALIVQNLITGNRAACGGGVYWVVSNESTVPLLSNNTIVNNNAVNGSGIYADGFDAATQLHNNVIVGVAGRNAVYCGNLNDVNTPVFRFNNVFSPDAAAYGGFCSDPTGINGNTSSDPIFADPARGDYRLRAGSPSIDAGDNAAPQVPNRDADGNARIADGNGDGAATIDIGAYERAAFLTPGSHDFGYSDLGAAPASKTFSISNPGTTTLTISSISIGNRTVGAGGSGDFAVAVGGSDPCPSLAPTLAPGQACTVVVTFTPTAMLGRKGATLRVVSDASGSPAVAPLFAEVAIDTSMTAAPPQQTTSPLATFTFTSNANQTTFECKLDTQTEFTACTSPMQYSLPQGARTFQVRALSKLGDPDPVPATYSWTIVPRARRTDFGGDRRSDILWRNTSTGENYIYPMDGTTILATEGHLRTVADLSWRVAGVGDFDGDGRADILWRNMSTGENYLYFMEGTAIKPTEGYIRTIADQAWQVAGVGDFDGDGKDDILWRNSVTGANYLFPMVGRSVKPNEGYLRTVADLDWRVVGVGDFDGDGKSDILWRNSTSGQNYLYPMDGRTIKANEGFIRTVADLNWKVAGVGDFNGDGRSDVLWHNSSTGENYLYSMSGTFIFSEGYLRMVEDLAWQIVAVGDYDGDGRFDILWRHSATGENYLYPMVGRTIKPTEGYLRTVPVEHWTVAER